MCIGVGIIFGSMNVIDPELLEGLLFSVANGRLKGQAEIIQRFKNRTGEPFLTQDGLCGYGHTWILKEALESAGAADKLKVADAIRKMNLTAGPAALSFPGPIKFDERGRRQDVPMIFAQWQQGVPVTVYPEDRDLAKPFWPSVWGSIQRRFSRLLVFPAKSSQTRAEIEKGSLDRPTSAVASVRGLAGRIGGSAVASGRFYGGIAEFAFWLLILPDAAAVA